HGEDAHPVLVANPRPMEGGTEPQGPRQQLAVGDDALPLDIGRVVPVPAGVALQVVGEGQGGMGVHGVVSGQAAAGTATSTQWIREREWPVRMSVGVVTGLTAQNRRRPSLPPRTQVTAQHPGTAILSSTSPPSRTWKKDSA